MIIGIKATAAQKCPLDKNKQEDDRPSDADEAKTPAAEMPQEFALTSQVDGTTEDEEDCPFFDGTECDTAPAINQLTPSRSLLTKRSLR